MPRQTTRRWMTLAAAAALVAGCAQPPAADGESEAGDGEDTETAVQSQAETLARELLIVDTHIDVPYRFAEGVEDISVRTEGGDFDYPRAKEGGLDAAFMSIYVPASYQETGGAREFADELIDMVEGFETSWPEKFAVARSTADVRSHFERGLVSLPMGMENGAPIERDLENLRHFHERGIRYITLTHSENNHISDSSYADERQWNGLSPFGREVVAEMNRLGVMIDVSHVSDAAFEQVLEVTRAPVIASHSSCRAFTPGWERNMSDDMIRALADNGGVIHINFGSAFLTEAAQKYSTAMWAAIGAFREESGLESGDPQFDAFVEQYRAENPLPRADVADVADHIDHVVELVGIDHVGLGSDYDGVGPTTPSGLLDVSTYPNLLRVLLERGYSREDLAKLAGENLMRVWSEVERVAAEG